MDVKAIVAKMTLEEKAGLCSGSDFWHTKGVERLGIPRMMVSDGPHGLRKQDDAADHLGINDSIKAVCFPAGCAAAASFDRGLLTRIGEILGEECQAEGVGVILGPAVNIKRSPLCGRNFEYYSEDPYLAGEMAASQIKGVQSKNVGTSIKHFLANSQEHRRMSSSSQLDERTAREIYLPAFERAVKGEKPWTLMCSYNRINGVYAAQNRKYLTDILRGEWGFDGFVVSDWGAVNERVADLEAGMDLEMPASFGHNDREIVKAVRDGSLKEEVLDRAVERILNIVFRFEENRDKTAVFDRERDHEAAREAAAECMVLLKNEGALPLKKDDTVAFIGAFAEKPRYQGGGSSHINSHKVEAAWELADKKQVKYAMGYSLKEEAGAERLIMEAVELAKRVKVPVIFAGLPEAYESEGYDREHMRMPEVQNLLIEQVAKVNPNTVVVLHNGSPVEMPWIDSVNGVLETYLAGEAVGGATLKVLYGEVNPSGHLAETFPLHLEDNPSYLFYRGEGDTVEYREGVFVGYRYYDTKKMPVLFPFGHGLSYTTFAYDNLKLDREVFETGDTLKVSLEITNTGACAGKEVVQLYVAPGKSWAIRPVHELKGFEKISLQPGETKTVTFFLKDRDFAYYDPETRDWFVEKGMYGIEIGASCRDIRLAGEVSVNGGRKTVKKITMDTTLGDIFDIDRSEEARALLGKVVFAGISDRDDELLGESTKEMREAMMRDMPLRNVLSFGDGAVTLEELKALVEKLNELAG